MESLNRLINEIVDELALSEQTDGDSIVGRFVSALVRYVEGASRELRHLPYETRREAFDDLMSLVYNVWYCLGRIAGDLASRSGKYPDGYPFYDKTFEILADKIRKLNHPRLAVPLTEDGEDQE